VVVPQKWDQESFGLVFHFAVSQNRSSDLDVTKYELYLCSVIEEIGLSNVIELIKSSKKKLTKKEKDLLLSLLDE